ncbi:MAG: DUF927 domain-containing protein [Clostridiales bacterium]|nr:DUF927 domain-containing protein [Clostridiales bacterium]MCI2161740.1 DUF927 domain-containing protein [Oscillospiraceae bacterium]MCI2191706.1 DUF927 domain-containing protein [Oscillospiraceae bacterium]MCI2205673.1 DUF927 domain-containing protein [Oscillospiraceae bacterium]
MEFHYAKEDFETPSPYEMILEIKDPFKKQITIKNLAEYAKSLKINNFGRLLHAYEESKNPTSKMIMTNSLTRFTNQPIELDSGEWHADDFGVYCYNRDGAEEYACPHPIIPVERLVNIDSGVEKLKIAFCKGDKRWRSIIAEKSVLASRQKILQLADQGVAVTSESAASLVRYLSDIENLNYTEIPEKKSVSRLGYIPEEGFSPYVEGLIFDGDVNFKHIFNSVQHHGNRQEWYSLAKQIRLGNVMARIVLASSFASVLVHPCGALPFFVHLWGGESGTGKTVALMLAASVWGSPEMGRYIQTFNSTVVGREKLAAFLNHLPLCVDELQLAKDARGKMMFDVYALAEGVGRTRGNKNGGVDQTPTWSNCILTTGETPITGNGSGAGAINRVIEIECQSAEKIIEDGHSVSNIVKKNYGFAGQEFVAKLYSDGEDNVSQCAALYKDFFKQLSDNDTTEKQAMAAAVVLTADKLATEWLFRDNKALTVKEIAQFLASKAAVSSGERGYRYMCDWVTQNANRMRLDTDQGDVFGLVQNDVAFVISSVFRKAAEDGGFSSPALLSYLKQRGLIETRGRAYTKCKRINGVATECVCMQLPKVEPDLSKEDLPF